MNARLRRNIGWLVTLAGVVIVLIGALADQIGLGGDGPNEFGSKQVAAVVVGIVILAAGVVVALWPAPTRARSEREPASVGSRPGDSTD
jgi:uncharacterized membrane protein